MVYFSFLLPAQARAVEVWLLGRGLQHPQVLPVSGELHLQALEQCIVWLSDDVTCDLWLNNCKTVWFSDSLTFILPVWPSACLTVFAGTIYPSVQGLCDWEAVLGPAGWRSASSARRGGLLLPAAALLLYRHAGIPSYYIFPPCVSSLFLHHPTFYTCEMSSYLQDFPSLHHLALHLLRLDREEEEYTKYLDWKNNYRVLNSKSEHAQVICRKYLLNFVLKLQHFAIKTKQRELYNFWVKKGIPDSIIM